MSTTPLALPLFEIEGGSSNVISYLEATQTPGALRITGTSGYKIVVVLTGSLGQVTLELIGTDAPQSVLLTAEQLSILGEGAIQVSATQTDGTSTSDAATSSFNLDSIAPTLTISSTALTLKAGETASITFSFSEDPGDSFSWDGLSGDVVVTGGSLSAISGSGLTRSATFTPKPGINGGSASISVSAGRYSDPAGNGGGGSSLSLSYDTQAPQTRVSSVSFSADSGISSTDLITSTASQTITGVLSDPLLIGESVEVSLDNGQTWITATASPGLSSWSLPTTSLSGSSKVQARVRDAAGNVGPLFSQAYAIDPAGPTLSSQFPAAGATNVAINNSIILSFSEAIYANGGTITAQTGSNTTNVMVITLTSGASSGSFTSGTGLLNGTWTISGNKLILDPSGNLASSQTYNIDIAAGALRDAAGNSYSGITSTSTSGIYFTAGTTQDTTSPNTAVSSIQFSADTGSQSNDFITNQAVQLVSGVLSANLAAGELVQLSADNGTTWQYADTCSTGSNLFSHRLTLSGSNTLRARVVDAAGNRARNAFLQDIVLTQAYTLDITPPNAPGLNLGSGVGDGANQNEALQSSGVVSVTGAAGQAITVVFQGSNGTVTKVVTGSGATPVAVVLQATDLPFLGGGVVNVSATQADPAGNNSPAATLSFVFDAVPPAAQVLSVALGPDTAGAGTSGTTSDFITNSAAQTISGSLSEALASGEVVNVSLDNGATWTAATTSGTSFTLATTLTGNNTLVVRVQDALGNFSTPLSQSYVLDSSAAPPGLVLAAGIATGATANEATNASGVLSVSAEPEAAIAVVFSRSGGGSVTKTLIGTGSAQAVVLTSADLDTLGDGQINVEATQIDRAGNTGVASTGFRLDRVAPDAPVITTKAFTSNTLNHTIRGTAEARATITLREGSTVLGTTVANDAGEWEALVFLQGQGAHAIQAWQRDEAGNEGPSASTPLAITVDVVASTPLLTKEDLQFILLQIGVAESHNNQLGGDAGIRADFADGIYNIDASQAALRFVLNTGAQAVPGAPAGDTLPLGLRSVEGFNNNLQPNQAKFGSADRSFSPATIGSVGVPTLSSNYDGDGSGSNPSYAPLTNVTDTSPRLISNLIADQTTSNAAAVAAAQRQQAQLDPELQKSANPQALQPQFDANSKPLVDVLNVAPNPANAPYNSFLTLFGQGFDHGLDFIDKGGSGTVMVPLLPGDPLYSTAPGAPNFIVVTRATVDAQGNTTNRTTPWIDMNQAYGSHSSMQVFLREYGRSSNKTWATGKLLEGSEGGLPTWADVKAQALNKLGILLTDQDVGNCPLIVADEYGRFIPGSNGYAQIVVRTGTDTSGNPILEIREGSSTGLALSSGDYAALRTGHAFLLDMAHAANPGGGKTADGDSSVGLKDANGNPITPNAQGQYSSYDNELLDRHFIAGDGRVNENQGLTAFHTMFHNEHDRLIDEYKRLAVESGDLTFLNQWLVTPATSLPSSVAEIPASNWNGERLFQAARFVVEMGYQHSVFEEFARFIDPNVAPDNGYLANLDPSITREFANVVYRFGHSMLNETVDRFSADWQNTSEGLIAAFVNPVAFLDPDNNGSNLSAADAGGEILRGMTRQQGNAIDEFVTGALRNNLLGMPLDLATINLVRARELGIPRLNEARQQFFNLTSNTKLAPYSSWVNFGNNLKHRESLINFVAAYGLHSELNALRDPNNSDPDRITKLRSIALSLINGTHINAQGKNDSADFMNATGTFASRRAGVDDIDFWIGGLAEKPEAQVTFLGNTFAFVFEQQLQALQNADRFYYLRRLAGNLLTQIEQNTFSALAQRTLNVTSLPGHLFSLPTYTLEVNASRQLTNLGNGKADPLGANRVNASAAEIGFTVDNTLRWNGGHVVLGGSEQRDLLQGGNENDTLYGRGGNDVIIGGDGNDQVWGGEGNDFIFDQAGLNLLRGEAGSDVIVSGSSLSILWGGSGKDWLMSGAGGGLGNELNGETDDDFISASDAGSIGNGGGGDDWFEGNSLGGADTYNLDDGLGAAVNINGNAVPQAVGHDVSLSRDGDDRIFGDYGNDIFIDGNGFDDYSGEMGFDWISFSRNGRDPGGSRNGGGAIDLSQVIPNAVARAGIQADLTDNRVEAAGGSSYADILVGDDRTDLTGGNVYLNRNNDLNIDGRDRDIMAPFNSLTYADMVLKGNNRNPVVNTHYAINPLTGQWGPAGGISLNRGLDDRLMDLPLDSGGIKGLFSDYTSNANGGGSFKSLIPIALQQTLEVNTRPNPLGTGINIPPVVVNSVPNSGVPGFPDVQGTISVPAYFNAGNVMIGGGGSDIIFGKAGDDVIDGDAWLNVELEWRNPNDPSQIVRFPDMKAINDAQLVLGLAINPSDIHVVRELASNPYEADGVTKANDMAVYYGRPDEYLFEGQRRVYVASIGTGGILQTDAVPVDYQEDPLTLFPINFGTNFLGSPDVREVDLNGNLLATTFDRNLLLNNFHPRTTIIGTPMDVDGDGFITITYAPTQAQLSDPLRQVALAPGAPVPVLQGTDYLRNIESVRFVLPSVANPTGSPSDPLAQLIVPTTYSTYTSRIGSTGATYTYSTYRDGTFVDVDIQAFTPTTAAVLPSVSTSSTPSPDPNTSKAINQLKEPPALPSLSVRLTTDSGRSTNDRISNKADLMVENLPAGYIYQWSNQPEYYSTSWKNLPGVSANATSVALSQSTITSTFGLSQGLNTLYFRVIENKDGGRIGPSQAFTFTYDTTAPAAPVQNGVGYTDGVNTIPDPWISETGAQLYYDTNPLGTFSSTTQPSSKPYYVLQEDAAGNRSAAAKSAFYYNLKSPAYNDGNTTTSGNNAAGTGYLLINNYQPGEKLLMDNGSQRYFFIDNYTTADGKTGIGVFLDDGTGSGKNAGVAGAWDGRDELLALVQTPNLQARMFSLTETKDASNTITSRTYSIDPASLSTKTFNPDSTLTPNNREALTGSAGIIDSFKLNSLNDALLPSANTNLSSSFDRIIGLNTNEDIIDYGPISRITASKPNVITTAVTALTTTAIAKQLTKNTFAANEAATFVFGSGASQRTFLALNNATAGFDNGDAVVEITGYSGPLNNLAIF